MKGGKLLVPRIHRKAVERVLELYPCIVPGHSHCKWEMSLSDCSQSDRGGPTRSPQLLNYTSIDHLDGGEWCGGGKNKITNHVTRRPVRILKAGQITTSRGSIKDGRVA